MVNQLRGTQYISDEYPFHIMRCVHSKHSSPPEHSHDFVELVYLVHGKGNHIFEGQSYPIYAGDIFIINPGEVHTYDVEEGEQLEIINCLFTPEIIHESLLRELGISQSMDYFYVHPFLDTRERFHHRLNLKGLEAEPVLSLLESMIAERVALRTGYKPVIKLQLLQLLLLLSRFYSESSEEADSVNKMEEKKALARRINGFLERHFDQKLSAPDLCKFFSISNRQLNRIFKQEMKQTVTERIHQIRIDRAKHYLLEGDDKVIHIALRVGYEDPSFFSQLFRRKVGCSPGQFRDMHRQEA